MATIVKSQLKLGFVVGTQEGKDIVKNRSIASIATNLTDELMGQLAQKLMTVSEYPAQAHRVDTKDLTV